ASYDYDETGLACARRQAAQARAAIKALEEEAVVERSEDARRAMVSRNDIADLRTRLHEAHNAAIAQRH
ncbi:unnamed protein product, partial [Scytosiphon promiscuus]